MKKCHKASSMSIPGSAWGKLAAFLDEWRERNRPEESFSKFEERLHDMVCELECEILAGELERYDIDVPVIEVEGERYKRVYRTEQVYLSGAGEVRVDRAVYRNSAGDRETICPMELRAGIVEGYWTVRAAELGAWSVAHMTPGESEQLFWVCPTWSTEDPHLSFRGAEGDEKSLWEISRCASMRRPMVVKR